MRLLCLSITLLTLIPASLMAQGEEEVGREPNPMRVAMEEVADEGAYAVYDGGEVTWADLTAFLARRSNYRQPLSWQPGLVADDFAGQIAFQRLTLDAARASDEAEGWVDPVRVNEAIRDVKRWHLVYDEVLEDLGVTREDALAYYEENREAFALPFEFYMRHLFLACYEEVEVQEGDTPTGIAERISGNPAAALDIRDSRSQRLLEGWDHEVDAIDELARPLVPGETLMVPMNPEGRAAVRTRLEEIASGIHSEEDFLEAARLHSSGDPQHRGEEIGPLPQRDEEFLPELLEAGRTLPLGEISDIIETKHGFQIVMITRRQMDEYRPFDTVSGNLMNNLLRERRSAAFMEWMEETVAEDGIIVDIPEDLDLINPTGASPEEAVATLPDGETITVAQIWGYLAEQRGNARGWWAQQPQGLINQFILLRASDILDRKFAEAELGEWADTLVEMQTLRQWVEPYISEVSAQRASQPTEEELRSHFEENVERFRRSPELTLRQVTVRPNVASGEVAFREARAEIEAALEGVENAEDFDAMVLPLTAEVVSGGASPESLGLQENVPLRRFAGRQHDLLADAQVGDIVGPERIGSSLMVWMVRDRTDFDLPVFEEIEDAVREDLTRIRMREIPAQMRDEVLTEAHFELVRPDHGDSPEI